MVSLLLKKRFAPHALKQGRKHLEVLPTDTADAQMVGSMRLVLAISAVLSISIDTPRATGVDALTWVVFSGYALHSLAIWAYAHSGHPFTRGRFIHWLDVCWYGLMVVCTGGVHSTLFLFYFFAILTSSFRWGFDEGGRVTIASAVLFVLCNLGSATADDIPKLLLRTTFLLSLGYMSVYWGGSKVELLRRLAMLREVSRVSNPRFGVDHTLNMVLIKMLEFFDASHCILVMRDREPGNCMVRRIKAGDAAGSIHAEHIDAGAAAPLLATPPHQVVRFRCSSWRDLIRFNGSAVYETATSRWTRRCDQASERSAELLEARSFISAPVHLKSGEGRIYIVSGKVSYRKSDALFLSHIVAQAFPVIENIELLDRMASEAALRERRKIALDLHDTAIQPYIGLKLAVSAIRNKATAQNPLIEDLDKLTAMATAVVDDLRRYAGSVKNGFGRSEQAFIAGLRMQAEQIREFYGIDIELRTDGDIHVSDRLAAEALQIVREGLSNICKHTVAQSGSVRVACTGGRLEIKVSNESVGHGSPAFLPRSISERASALGGKAYVDLAAVGTTAVHVEIPI